MSFQRLKQRMEETHGTFLELVRHFFARMFDSDLVTDPDQYRTFLIGVMSAICAMATYAPITSFRKYVDLTYGGFYDLYHRTAMTERFLYILMPMLLVGFVTTLHWQSLFPSSRDYLILMPLPITRLKMFSAKLVSLGIFVLLFSIAFNLFPSFFLPVVQDSIFVLHPTGIGQMVMHGVASIGGGVFVFFTMVTVQGLLMNLLGKSLYPRVSLLVQAGLLLSLMVLLPQVFAISGMYRTEKIPLDVQRWLPPFWFHGIYEVAIGRPEPHFAEFARMGWLALIGSVVSTVLVYGLTYVRQASAAAENENKLPFSGAENLARWAFRKLKPREEEMAVLSFVLKTLARSRQHKLVLSVYLGLGTAILATLYLGDYYGSTNRRIELLQAERLHTAMSAALVVSFFLLSGLRVVFSIPVSLESNWIFRMLESEQRVLWLDAVVKAYYVLGILPVLLTAPLFLAPLMGWEYVPGHLVICVLLVMILVELMLFEWQKVPFVCSYFPGKKNVALMIVVYWTAFGAFAFSTATFEIWCMREFSRWLIMLGLLIAVYGKLREIRRESWGAFPLHYEDMGEELVTQLRIS